MRLVDGMKKGGDYFWFPLLLFLLSFSFRFWTYNQSSYANGWDAYFYIVQIKSYIEEGSMHSSRVSLFYPLLLAVQFLNGNYELTYKMASSILVGGFSLQLFRTAKSLAPESNFYYLIGAYTLFSPQLTYFGAQFAKNLMGVVFFLLLVEYAVRSRWFRVLVIGVMNLFVHKMTAGLSIVFTPIIALKDHIKGVLWKYVLITVLVLIVTFVVFPQLIVEIPLISSRFGSPNLAGIKFIESIQESITLEWKIEIISIYVLFSLAIIKVIYSKSVSLIWYVLLLLLLGLTFPLLEWSVLGLSYRLLMVFLILCPILIACFPLKIEKKSLVILCSFLTSGGIYSSINYPYDKLDPPYATYDYLTKKVERLDLSPELIIMHKALAEYYTFKTGKDAIPWVPEYDIPVEALWRVGYGISAKELAYFAEIDDSSGLVYELSPSYILASEEVWQRAMSQIQQEDSEFLEHLMTWRNPHEIRPAYLLKK
ncbi:hypothetical protein [Marinoscillum pacificum]|uniref:hypothetical protein n=1 Tax=Marinoscillum pacificum TaxID=392723 RepID=UPI00215731B1|nr:hypothetical protein [Marinoscillum pacificum]